jgi:hypothetical protein
MKLQSNAIFYRQLTFQNFHKQHFAVHQYTTPHITVFLYILRKVVKENQLLNHKTGHWCIIYHQFHLVFYMHKMIADVQ